MRRFIPFAICLAYALPAQAQDRKEMIFAHTQTSIDARVEYMVEHDMKCATVVAEAAKMCRPYNFEERSMSNSDEMISEGRELLALQSMTAERAKTCGVPAESIWTPKCDASRANLVSTWTDQLDTYTQNDAPVVLMAIDHPTKKGDFPVAARQANVFIKDALNWVAFNQQLGFDHPAYTEHYAALTSRWKKLAASEAKRIAKNRCPKATYKDAAATKGIHAAAKTYFAGQNHANATYDVRSIRLTGKPFTSSADDGSKVQTISAASCIKATFPHRKRCYYNTLTAKRYKHAGSESWEPWRYHYQRYGADVPCSKAK